MAETMLCKDGEQEALLHDGAPKSADASRSTPTEACWPTANRSARPGSDRCSNSCISFAAPPGPAGAQQPEGALAQLYGRRDRRGRNPQSVTAKRKDSPDDADRFTSARRGRPRPSLPEFREDPTARSGGCANQVAGGVFAALRRILALVDYASVFEASRDDELFNSAPSIGVPPSPIPFPILPIESDPPKH
ncbi:propanoyl-CoA C-acyltransferase domain protein [Mycobacterium xenopi 4042]|uniref:Propanoyl-CoA C-acyltransferase domain protein n=1 Tax=Mycobacterium xenopi 4042 TaxID=1299334 RepID=X8BLM1_MYCXE|nr:propanoyl-CoA C-acyltransferase domain protein [Mycobacterium xenopi 4042]